MESPDEKHFGPHGVVIFSKIAHFYKSDECKNQAEMSENILTKGKPDKSKNRYFYYGVFVPKRARYQIPKIP